MITLFCVRPKGLNVGNDAIYLGMQQFLAEAFGQVVNLISIPVILLARDSNLDATALASFLNQRSEAVRAFASQ